ncbi:MAG: 30S ribosomal protein S2 [Patescibacteria group bacterium]
MPIDETVLNLADVYPQDDAFKEMIDAGVFYGRKKTKTNPRMKPFIFGNRNGIEIIDLQKTAVGLQRAVAFVKEKVRNGEDLVLFVGTQPAAHDLTDLVKEFNAPTVTNRWIGGTLTNFKTISKLIERLKSLKSDRAMGLHDKYTKKERLTLEREVARLENLVGSLHTLTRLPDILLVIDSKFHTTAVREATRLHIPMVAFDNTDANPDHTDYMVVGNNAARGSVKWFLEKIAEAIHEGKREAAKLVTEEKTGEVKEVIK